MDELRSMQMLPFDRSFLTSFFVVEIIESGRTGSFSGCYLAVNYHSKDLHSKKLAPLWNQLTEFLRQVTKIVKTQIDDHQGFLFSRLRTSSDLKSFHLLPIQYR
ncbi:hypothetical protein OUZ56_020817 [Daphnia magna]|uniref:Uncharacterized protein n=1 Tax=Daphnia magna TaxID=35525 RepID=A0ABQ9ZFJ8_9CRUS|nr:hypothetical protein OUZ56_020817 [Daphnia magna]